MSRGVDRLNGEGKCLDTSKRVELVMSKNLRNNDNAEMTTDYQAAQVKLSQDVQGVVHGCFPSSPNAAFGEQFFQEHGARSAARQAVRFEEIANKLTRKMKPRSRIVEQEFEKASRENSVFLEAKIRPLLCKPYVKAHCQKGAENVLSFSERTHFVLLHISVKKAIVEILDWATSEFEGGVTERVMQYVLLGLDILLNDCKFKVLSPRVQIVALKLQYQDLYLFQARLILFRVWERHFSYLSPGDQILELEEAVSAAAQEKADCKNMDVSAEYIMDVVRKCEYLSARGENVAKHIYNLLSSNLSLWHKYHIAKAISSPALAKLQACDAHYAQLLDAMKHSIDIAISSAQVGAASRESLGESVVGDMQASTAGALEGDYNEANSYEGNSYENNSDDDNVDVERDDYRQHAIAALIEEYVDDLILSASPPEYIQSLDSVSQNMLLETIKTLFGQGAKRDVVDALLGMLANPDFVALSVRAKRRLIIGVKNIAISADDGQSHKAEMVGQALYNFVYFVCHPQLSRLSKRDVEWLIESVERLDVNFYDNSEAAALIEFLECFHKVTEGAELTTMHFHLGRLAPVSAPA